MMKKVIWAEFASDNLKLIYNYHKNNANISVAKKIKKKIFEATFLVYKQPEMGQVEFWLEHLGEGHRYLVVGNYKIIYRNIDDMILITDIFDTRQNPSTMNDKKRNG